MKNSLIKRGLVLVTMAFFLAACNLPLDILGGDQTTATPQAVDGAPTATPASAVATATPEPEPEYLTICLGQEPNTLYPYGLPNQAARSVLAAIYDGPIDVFLDGYQPVILETIPSIENGDAQIVPAKAKRGDLVMNTDGDVVLLDAGVNFFPPGCNELACAQRYNGTDEIEMDQMVVTFRIKPDILWSDGQPLTARDSIFAFRIASDTETPASKFLVDRTQTYEEVDELTVQWWGRPGFLDPTYADNFWTPLPQHAWERFSAGELARADVESMPPLGWGAYVFETWTRGESIRLRKNPGYFRAEDGFPTFSILTFRFLRDTESGISALTSGECDLLDSSLRLEGQIELLRELEANNSIKTAITQTNIMERLDFGIQPAAYDDGLDLNDRPNLLSDVRTRQAIAYCLNRQGVVDKVLSGLTTVPASFVWPAHPAYGSDITSYPFDPNKGIALLEQAGWVDADKDPATPRVSSGATGLPDGIKLSLTYQTSDALQRRQAAEILAASLGECGIGVEVKHIPVSDLYAAGPEGPLFGRQFDLGVYAVGTSGTEPACFSYTESEIPNKANNWIGTNVMGYKNSDFDALCQQADRNLPDQPAYQSTYARMQTIFVNDLPSIPLYARIKAAAFRPDLCNFELTPTSIFDLWNIEELDIDPLCVTP